MNDHPIVQVHDLMQEHYVYTLSTPMGKEFHPDFKPQLTPKEMLALGVFGGVYLRDCTEEFPSDWFTHAKLSTGKKDVSFNFFQVDASQSLAIWKEKGWIHPDDPRGWFQWYCRYYMGRRHTDDERQIARWKAVTRHVAQLQKYCRPGDITCRPRQRQALLHWAYDSRVL
ncbi:MAG: hypothetical protein WAV30_01775 [Microgenomates group bacterium]